MHEYQVSTKHYHKLRVNDLINFTFYVRIYQIHQDFKANLIENADYDVAENNISNIPLYHSKRYKSKAKQLFNFLNNKPW